eukprot:8710395-Alexandrium_andersonii.AAC.1
MPPSLESLSRRVSFVRPLPVLVPAERLPRRSRRRRLRRWRHPRRRQRSRPRRRRPSRRAGT